MTTHDYDEKSPAPAVTAGRKACALLAVSVLAVGLGACSGSSGDKEAGRPAAHAPAGPPRATAPATPTAAPTATSEPTATPTPPAKVRQVSEDDDSEPQAPTRRRELPAPTTAPKPAPVPPRVFSVKPRTNTSTARARLVGLTTARGNGVESVTFRFADTEVVPKYDVRYVKVVRAHPEDDPIAVEGNAYLEVSFKLTNPNVAGRLAVPPDLTPGQPQVREILLVHNVAGSLKFGVGVTRQAEFRLHESKGQASLVLEVRDR